MGAGGAGGVGCACKYNKLCAGSSGQQCSHVALVGCELEKTISAVESC